MPDPFLIESLRTQVSNCRGIASEARRASLDYVTFQDDSPVGYAITDGELYHGHLRNAEHFEGMAQGLEKAVDILLGGEL